MKTRRRSKAEITAAASTATIPKWVDGPYGMYRVTVWIDGAPAPVRTSPPMNHAAALFQRDRWIAQAETMGAVVDVRIDSVNAK